MKLEVTIPDRIGWIPVVSVADIFGLLLAFVVLSPAFLLESGIPVDLPTTDRDMLRFSDPIIVSVQKVGDAPIIYVGRDKVEKEELEAVLSRLLSSDRYTEGDSVVLRADKNITVDLERSIMETIQKLGLRCALAARPKE